VDAAEVLVQVAKVYLLRVVDAPGVPPKANMPLVPTGPPVFPPNPYPWAENAPLVEIIGILFKLRYGSNNRIGRICRFGNCVGININP